MRESHFPPVALPDSPFAPVVQHYCLDLPNAWEDYPWGDVVYKVGAKMFAALGAQSPLAVTVKATPEDASVLVRLPHISVAPYIGRHGWVRIAIDDESSLDQALALIHVSYELVTRSRR